MDNIMIVIPNKKGDVKMTDIKLHVHLPIKA